MAWYTSYREEKLHLPPGSSDPRPQGREADTYNLSGHVREEDAPNRGNTSCCFPRIDVDEYHPLF